MISVTLKLGYYYGDDEICDPSWQYETGKNIMVCDKDDNIIMGIEPDDLIALADVIKAAQLREVEINNLNK